LIHRPRRCAKKNVELQPVATQPTEAAPPRQTFWNRLGMLTAMLMAMLRR